MARCTSHETRMNQTRESNSRDMSTTCEDPFEIPDCFRSEWIMLIQESAAVFLVENSGKPPWLLWEWLDVKNLDDENIAGMCALDFDWAREIMDTTRCQSSKRENDFKSTLRMSSALSSFLICPPVQSTHSI